MSTKQKTDSHKKYDKKNLIHFQAEMKQNIKLFTNLNLINLTCFSSSVETSAPCDTSLKIYNQDINQMYKRNKTLSLIIVEKQKETHKEQNPSKDMVFSLNIDN